MARLAIAGRPRLEVSDLELRREGPSFTIDTVRELRRANPGCELFLVLGSDSLATFPRWREAPALLEETTPVVVPRRGAGMEVLESARGSLGIDGVERLRRGWLEVPLVDVSATEIRARLAQRSPVDGLVPKNVIDYIRERRLYQP
jgi:nicotinate-nucleotide adenylyltransferase